MHFVVYQRPRDQPKCPYAEKVISKIRTLGWPLTVFHAKKESYPQVYWCSSGTCPDITDTPNKYEHIGGHDQFFKRLETMGFHSS